MSTRGAVNAGGALYIYSVQGALFIAVIQAVIVFHYKRVSPVWATWYLACSGKRLFPFLDEAYTQFGLLSFVLIPSNSGFLRHISLLEDLSQTFSRSHILLLLHEAELDRKHWDKLHVWALFGYELNVYVSTIATCDRPPLLSRQLFAVRHGTCTTCSWSPPSTAPTTHGSRV